MIVLIPISKWIIKDDNDKDDDDKDNNDNNDDNNDDEEDDDEDDNRRVGGYNDDDDDDDDRGFWEDFRNSFLRFSGDFERILGIVFYDFLRILGGF